MSDDAGRPESPAAAGLSAGDVEAAVRLDRAILEAARQLFDLARDGATEVLEATLEAGAPVDLLDHQGNGLLILAAYHGRVDTVQMLLRHGADPSIRNDRGQTALAAAVFQGYADVVEALLDAGVDPDEGSPSPVAIAELFDLPEIRAQLIGARID
jgi:ankyrin repeat protein